MTRIEPTAPSGFETVLLSSDDTKNRMKLLQDIASSCYGPQGHIKMIRNTSGGHVTMSSTSRRLFQVLTVQQPINKLITSSAEAHVGRRSDGGLFSTLLCLYLVKSSIDLQFSRQFIIEVYDELLQICVNYLMTDHCFCKLPKAKSDIKVMHDLVRSIIGTKPASGLTYKSLEFLTKLLVSAFVHSLPSEFSKNISMDKVTILPLPDRPALDSLLFPGFLHVVGTEKPQKGCGQVSRATCGANKGKIKTAVVNISLSGDSEEFLLSNYEINSRINVDKLMVEKLLVFGHQLITNGVGVLFCQKVVHPQLKRHLQSSHVMVVDRLGDVVCQRVLHLTDAEVISSISSSLPEMTFGWLDDLTYKEIFGKWYLHLLVNGTEFQTLLLCNSQEEMLEELKTSCQAALDSLHFFVRQPFLLVGGGCWEVSMAAYVRMKASKEQRGLLDKLQCTKHQLMSTTETFAHCLELVAMTISKDEEDHYVDTMYHHFWRVPRGVHLDEPSDPLQISCSCGVLQRSMVTAFKSLTKYKSVDSSTSLSIDNLPLAVENIIDRNIVIDSGPVRLAAFKAAVLTAMTVLDIGQCVTEK